MLCWTRCLTTRTARTSTDNNETGPYPTTHNAVHIHTRSTNTGSGHHTKTGKLQGQSTLVLYNNESLPNPKTTAKNFCAPHSCDTVFLWIPPRSIKVLILKHGAQAHFCTSVLTGIVAGSVCCRYRTVLALALNPLPLSHLGTSSILVCFSSIPHILLFPCVPCQVWLFSAQKAKC